MGTPLERFDAWLTSESGQKAVQGHTAKLGLNEVQRTVQGLRSWLDRYENSPRAKKTAWGSFLKNNLPSKKARHNGRKQPATPKRSGTGERTF